MPESLSQRTIHTNKKHISDIVHFPFTVMKFIKQLSCPNCIIYPVLTFTPDIFSHYYLSLALLDQAGELFFHQIGSCTRLLSQSLNDYNI